MSTATDASSGTQFASSIAELNEIRSRDPQRIKQLLGVRRKRELFGPDGKLMIIACDHPARGALGAGIVADIVLRPPVEVDIDDAAVGFMR